MSRSYSALDGKNQKQSKAKYQMYFKNPSEPRESKSAHMTSDYEVELLEDCGPMRQEFRRLAQKMRNMNSV